MARSNLTPQPLDTAPTRLASRPRCRLLPVLLLCLLAFPLLTACMNGDDDDPTPVTGTSVSADSAPTTTPAIDSAASPEATASDASASPPAAGETPTAFVDSLTDEERTLLPWVLTTGDLSEEWVRIRLDSSRETPAGSVCNAEPYVPASGPPPTLEVEFQSTDSTGFIAQTVLAMADADAVAAMEALRTSATCGEWTDPTGITYTLQPRVAPSVGDESLAVRISFPVEGAGTLEGDIFWMRYGGTVVSLSYLQLDGYDPATADIIVATADARAQVNSGALDPTAAEAALIEGLLNVDNMSADWDQLEPARASDPERWTQLCGAGPQPHIADGIARVSVSLSQGFTVDSASLQQLLVAYPAGVGTQAFAWEREAIACDSFVQVATEITLTPTTYPANLADEIAAVQFDYEQDGRAITGQWIVIRSGDLVSTIIYTAPAVVGIDSDVLESIVNVAAQKMTSVTLP